MRPLVLCRAAALFAPGLLLLAFAPVSLGASFFISPSGKDTNRCTNQATDACATFPRCAAVMAAGDTCFALDGTYLVTDTDPASPRMGWVFRSPGGTRTARKRFTSLSQDARKVTIKSATPRTQNTYYLLGAASSNQSDYLEFDHLTFEGRMEGGENLDGFTYHHNVAKCPNIGTGGGNQAPIYLQEMNREMHKDIHIYNNLFLMDSSCDLPPSNVQFIVAFSFNGAIIENNDFVNLTSKPMFAFVYLKRANKDTVVRYNWFKGFKGDPLGVWLMDCNGDSSLNEFGDRSAQGGSPDCNNKVYQNLFVGISSGAQCRSESGRHEWIYNNTVVDPGTRCLGVDSHIPGSGDGYQIFNNLCYGRAVPSDGHVTVPPYGNSSDVCMAEQAYFDNNLYWPAPTGSAAWKDCRIDTNGDGQADGDQLYSTLADWKAHLASSGMERFSTVEDPLFVAPSRHDFRLQPASPARTGGRGGAWPSARGAYVSGYESIGCTFDSRCHAYPTDVPPGPPAPMNVVRSDAY
ncbi:MAG: hypothetical protein H6Q28_1725 [Bacteroidetes bacterium]|nr:hypothetical protein [Bacteroidota bacterium]